MGERIARIAIVAVLLIALVAIWLAYTASTRSPAQQSAIDVRADITSVRESLSEQDASILRFTTTRDKAELAPFFKARQTFDAQVTRLGAQLSHAPAHSTPSAFKDLQATYQTWLGTVAPSLAYESHSHQYVIVLLRRDKSLMEQIAQDLDALSASRTAAGVSAKAGRQDETTTPLVVAVALLTLLSIIAFIAEERRAVLETERRRILDTVDELVAVADARGRLIRVSPAWQRTLGYSMGDLPERALVDLVHPDDRGATAYEIFRIARNEPVRGFRNRFRAKDGLYHSMVWNAVPDRSRRLIYISARDETEQVRVESELTELSYADPLTGLPNRRQFFQQLQRSINLARRHRLSFSLLYLDLDQLKQINDRISHAAGDEALKGVVANIAAKLRESDLFARVGGDEFAILTPPIALPRDVDALAHKIVDAAAQPMEIGDTQLIMTVSLGIASFPEEGTTPSDLLGAADRAMYSAKRSGGGSYARAFPQAQESPPGA